MTLELRFFEFWVISCFVLRVGVRDMGWGVGSIEGIIVRVIYLIIRYTGNCVNKIRIVVGFYKIIGFFISWLGGGV